MQQLTGGRAAAHKNNEEDGVGWPDRFRGFSSVVSRGHFQSVGVRRRHQ